MSVVNTGCLFRPLQHYMLNLESESPCPVTRGVEDQQRDASLRSGNEIMDLGHYPWLANQPLYRY